MGDMRDDFLALTQARKERHAAWFEKNKEEIIKSSLTFVDKGTVLLFRNNIKADFYPHTGRWRSNNKTYSGGAKTFINWFLKNDKRGR